MNNASILAIKTYTPGNKVQVQQLEEKKHLNEAELTYFESCGIQTVNDATQHNSFDLALGAANKLLDEEGIDPKKLDVVIYIQSRVPDTFISSEATHLQHKIGAENALTFSIGGLGCTDSTTALKLACDFLKANRKMKNVLIVYGNKMFSKHRFRYPVTLMGDGGVAALIGRSDSHVIEQVNIISNGKYWDLFSMDHKQTTADNYKEQCTDVRSYGFELAIESKNRFTKLMDDTLQRLLWEPSEVKHVMMQNIASRAYQYYQDALGIAINPICEMNLKTLGHLGAADIFVNYAAAQEAGILNEGDKVIIMNNSPVAAWSTIAVRC